MLPVPGRRGWLDAVGDWLPAPDPWAAGTHDLWVDPRIARNVLAAHLDPASDEASRRPQTIDASVAWIASLLPDGGRVLDLGCGPGLYAQRLAARGFDVTGVDRSPTSIAHARAAAPALGLHVTYVRDDYLDVALEGPFDLVMIVYYDLGVLDPIQTDTLLNRIGSWLGPHGRLVFDVRTPRARPTLPEPTWGFEQAGFWAPEPHLWLETTSRYDPGPVHLEQTIVLTEHEAPRVYRIWERAYTPESIEALLAAADLRVESVLSDLTGRPLTDDSQALGVVARPADPARQPTAVSRATSR